MDYLQHLNAAQREAVTTTHGPVLVIAGAGSGKTRVIEYRVLHLVKSGIAPESILLLTFTRRASQEMLHRASQHDPRSSKVEGGTFHAFGYRALRKYGERIGLTGFFTILDEDDAGELIQRCVSSLGFLDRTEKFPKKDTLRYLLSSVINKGQTIERTLIDEYPDFEHFAADIEELQKAYQAHKKQSRCFDYDDLLVYLRELLRNDEVRRELASKYQFVMVDEFQDTNGLQADIVRLLALDHGNVMVVGDDAQSIYGFRGAIHKNIIDFPSFFPNTKVIKLEENYRSTQPVLDLANRILENMESKFSKTLVAAQGGTGERPQLMSFSDSYEEAHWIGAIVKDLYDGGMSLHEQAVLFRSSYASLPLQAELVKRKISYQVFGGMKFYELAHVKDLLAHLRIVVNPKDELSWSRALQLLEGIGGKTAQRILTQVLSLDDFEKGVHRIFEENLTKSRSAEGLKRFRDAFLAAFTSKDVHEQYQIFLDYYRPILREKFDDWQGRLSDLETLSGLARRYDALADLLADFTLEPPGKRVGNDQAREDVLTLSTIHSAKGLEWKAVFFMAVQDGVIPTSRAADDSDAIEEERRLFYVAVTRAKKLLFITYSHEASGGRWNTNQIARPSRFLRDPKVFEALGGESLEFEDEEKDSTRPTEDEDGIIYEYDNVNRFRW